MRAARFHNREDIRVEQIDEPTLKDGKVMVDVEWCGICGSDLHEYTQGPLSFAVDEPHVLTGETMPVALGHEFCGRVRNPSAGSGLKDGDAVMVDPRIVCRKCAPCKIGATHGCQKLGYHGYHTGGGFAERAAVDEKMLHKLPDNVSLDCAAVIEPLAVVQHAIKETGLSDWKTKDILVIGGGPIGLALIIALRAHGAQKIIVSEPALKRRKQVAEFATTTLDPTQDDVVGKCRELTGGEGVEVLFDCAGVPAGLETGFECLRFQGIYMNVAIWEKPMVIPVWAFMRKHISVKSAIIFSDEDFAETMQMMAEGKFVGYEKLVTGRIKLEDIVDKGFKELVHNKDEHIKILVSTKI